MVANETMTTEPNGFALPTIWGLEPTQVHDRYWAARGVQVVRQGERSQIVHDAELFLLTDPRSLAVFPIGRLVERIAWVLPDLVSIRLHSTRDRRYRERVSTDPAGRFQRFQRIYDAGDTRLARVALTPNRRVAEEWLNAPDPREGWRRIRRLVQWDRRFSVISEAQVYDRHDPRDLMQLIRDLIRLWESPDATIPWVHKAGPAVWIDAQSPSTTAERLIGPAWIGAGRQIPSEPIIGPAVLWDDPLHRPDVRDIEWLEIEPSSPFAHPVRPARRSSFHQITKRLFDLAFALTVLLLTLPFYPLICLAIALEDGRPFFFIHRRETRAGALFPCIKFRSMRKDADRIRDQLALQNRADGPQFFIDPNDDPRLTRVGRFLRATNLDEIPQFINVLLGHMSVVGPRPSPRSENQFNPAWREARLSVRPGITGLWQVMRTRRQGEDFQEWIKYDLRYVERQTWAMDLMILWRTILIVLRMNPSP